MFFKSLKSFYCKTLTDVSVTFRAIAGRNFSSSIGQPLDDQQRFLGRHQRPHFPGHRHEGPGRNRGRSLGLRRVGCQAVAHLHGRHGIWNGTLLSAAHLSGKPFHESGLRIL